MHEGKSLFRIEKYKIKMRLCGGSYAECTFKIKYDRANKMTRTEEFYSMGGSETDYLYDLAGNIARETVDGEATEYAYDIQNRLLSRSGAKGAVSYEYDADGNLTKETSAEGEATYEYSPENRMTLGTNEAGETSEYVYDALGVRTENIQTRHNENYEYRHFSFDNGSPHMKNYLPALSDGRETWQPAWESEVGSTVQNEVAVEHRSYTVDHLSLANRDIIVYAAGMTEARFVYSPDGTRFSGEFLPAEGTFRGESGENIGSDAAGDVVSKLYYHGDHLGGDLFALDEEGDVALHILYDPWGLPRTNPNLEINYYGADPAADYTGYTHDKTLNLYFAQFRFYDPETRRFTQEDPVKDGADWYVYVYDNPLMWVDPLGLYYIVSEIGRDGKTYYHAEPQTGFITFKKGVKNGILPEEFNDYVSDYAIDRTGDILSKKFPKIAKLFGSAGTVLTLIQVGSEINSEYKNVQKYDDVIFKLFEIARFTTRTTSEFELKELMRKAYSFVNSYSDYFFRNVCGMADSFFEIDVKIKESENAEEKIKSYSDQYYKSFFRGVSSRSVFKVPGKNGDWHYGTTLSNYYKDYADEQRKKFESLIDMYDETLTAFAQSLVEYITLIPETVIGPRTVM